MARYIINDDHGNTIATFEAEREIGPDDLSREEEEALALATASGFESGCAAVFGARLLEANRPERIRSALFDLQAACERL